MVLALASNTNVVTVAKPPKPPSMANFRLTAYDIWCLGISQMTYGCIGDESEVSAYNKLLGKNREEARRWFTALAGPKDAHNYKYETKKP
jgi:hypothetical protein